MIIPFVSANHETLKLTKDTKPSKDPFRAFRAFVFFVAPFFSVNSFLCVIRYLPTVLALRYILQLSVFREGEAYGEKK